MLVRPREAGAGRPHRRRRTRRLLHHCALGSLDTAGRLLARFTDGLRFSGTVYIPVEDLCPRVETMETCHRIRAEAWHWGDLCWALTPPQPLGSGRGRRRSFVHLGSRAMDSSLDWANDRRAERADLCAMLLGLRGRSGRFFGIDHYGATPTAAGVFLPLLYRLGCV